MSKKKFYLFLFLIIFIFILFFVLMYYENTTYQNTLNLGQPIYNSQKLKDNSTLKPPIVYFCPEDNCKDILLSLINNSFEKIDCAIYSFTSKELSEALIKKKEKGINIRIVTDNQRSTTKSSQIGNLKISGIDVLISPFSENYMHNKFCIFDSNIVFFGSLNFTEESFSESNNNMLIFENTELADILIEKINSFYLGNFSKSSTVLDETITNDLNIFFCPNTECENTVLENIKNAKSEIYCMLYSFTKDDFAEELLNAKEKDINIKIILENQQVTEYSSYQKLKANDISIILDNNPFLMHHKFCIFDNEIILTGSMNFSNNGINNNDESFIVLRDKETALAYSDYFENKWFFYNKAN